MMTNNNVQKSNKIPNGKPPPPPPPHAHALSSLPRFGSARREHSAANEQAESTLSHEPPYSQHLANQNGPRANTNTNNTTADRYTLRLTQDHFNHNQGPYGSIGSNNKHANTLSGGERSPREFEGNYIHNNSHYSLPLDHALSSTPTPTPTPPALPMRNGQIMQQSSNNTATLQRIPAYNNNNCSNGYATIGNGGIAIGVGGGGGGNANNNNNGSLRRYH